MSVRKHEFNDDGIDNSESNSQAPFEISPEIRQRIRNAAIRNHLSISEYLERTIPSETDTDRQQGIITQEAIERLRQLRKQIRQDHHGKIFEDSTEMIRQMRDERTKQLEGLLGE
jgi:hypothetical protein